MESLALKTRRVSQYPELFVKPFKAAAVSLGMSPIVAPVRDSTEIEPVVDGHAREPDCGLIVMPDVFLLASD
jgi:putative tryptophan/tyrosine transport system substrate-binding protein